MLGALSKNLPPKADWVDSFTNFLQIENPTVYYGLFFVNIFAGVESEAVLAEAQSVTLAFLGQLPNSVKQVMMTKKEK